MTLKFGQPLATVNAYDHAKWLSTLGRPCKVAYCDRTMKIANLEAAGAGLEWPRYECKGPHHGRLLEYGEAL